MESMRQIKTIRWIIFLFIVTLFVTSCQARMETAEAPEEEAVEAAIDPPTQEAEDSTDVSIPPAEDQNLQAVEIEEGMVSLTIAGFGISQSSLNQVVNEFNKVSEHYTVSILDYGYAEENVVQGRQQLNTELLAGKGPDMLCFDLLSPLPYIAKGLLLDMEPLLDQDPEISREDIVIWNALSKNAQLHVIAPKFSIDSLSCAADAFKGRDSWSISEYMTLSASLEDWQDMIYYMNPAYFVEEMGGRYLRGALDLENATCDFDNELFLEILQAALQVSAADSSNSDKSGAQRMAEGQLMACAEWIDTVDDLAFDRYRTGDGVKTYLGYPTPDGSSGTDAVLSTPIGICSQTEHAEGCWEFAKYLLTHPVIGEGVVGIPTYLPKLEEAVETFNAAGNAWTITEQDVDQLLTLAAGCSNASFNDEVILSIILEEADIMFQGDATAEEVAKRVQDRVSLYMMEQYG